MDIEVDCLPEYVYPAHARLRVQYQGTWVRFIAGERDACLPNTYSGHPASGEPLTLCLSRHNHAPELEPSMDIEAEHHKYFDTSHTQATPVPQRRGRT